MAAALASAVLAPAAGASPFLAEPDRIPVDPAVSQDVAVLDFNGDGWPDIALTGGRKVELVLGRPDGWDPPQSITLAGIDSFGPSRLAATELTGDAFDDLLVAVPGLGAVTLLRGRTDGVLTAPEQADVHAVADPDGTYAPWPTAALDLGDLDGNDTTDVVAMFRPAAGFTGRVVPLVNDGHGGLTPQAPMVFDTPADVQLVSLGGDDDPDLVVAQGDWPGDLSDPPKGRMSLRAGDTGATFSAGVSINTTGAALGLAAGDVSGDGTPDVITGVTGHGVTGPQLFPGDAVSPALGAPTFLLTSNFPEFGSTVAVGDVDRDGQADVAVNSESDRSVSVILHEPGGTFRLGSGAYTFPDVVLAWTLADADGDGKLDIVAMTNEPGTAPLHVYYGSGPRIRPPSPIVDFGEVALGAGSPPLAGPFSNDGPGPASDLIVIGSGDVKDFPLVHDGCTHATLAVGKSCSMAALFRPRAAGDRELDVAVVAPDSDEADWLALVGTGVVPHGPPPAPVVSPPVPSPIPAATLKRTSGARLTGRGRKLRFRSGWRATCPRTGPACRVSLLLIAKARPGRRAPVIARAQRDVLDGRSQDIVARVTRAGRLLLARRHSARAVLQLKAERDGAATASVNRTVKVRLARPKTRRG